MTQNCISLILPLLCVIFQIGFTIEQNDYYWKDYIGYIPNDAIAAGKDKQGQPVYVGQAFFKDIGLLPTTIYVGFPQIKVTAWGKVFETDKNIKILCSKHPDYYKWIPTTIDAMHLLTNCLLLPGGTETDTTLHIGRANHQLETQIGKIYPCFSKFKGLALPHNGQEANYKTFEVLSYNCTSKSTCDN
ncbi:hypothetical protein FQA39_LY08206 [Lamprigera yunnana]|nr:hypothetical protein FQA39_LY08206 [Lamprigera yunnana]